LEEIMQFKHFSVSGPVEVMPRRLGDARGYFAETYRADKFAEAVGAAGVVDFVQENESLSAQIGTIRGLHFQSNPAAQGKLVRCVAGAILDVAVDLRHGSPTFGQWVVAELTGDNGHQLWVPTGFAHGFCTLVPNTLVSYKVTSYYSPENDKGVLWNDPDIGIEWPALASAETLSAKDRIQPVLADLPPYFDYAFEGRI
jgi:dTDP-4-dehydrorhamnose 3,5-epimerase